MVDYESALAIANLTQEEVDAIAHHEDRNRRPSPTLRVG